MTVLVADDEDLARYTIRTLISRNHPNLRVVAEAADGDEAVDSALSCKPDLVILDIRMPGIDGIEAARRIRRKCPETAILILTAYEDFSMAQHAVNTGVDGYLLKPVSPEAFAERITLIREKVRMGSSPPEAAAVMDSEPKVSWRLNRALDCIRSRLSHNLPLEAVAKEAGIGTQHLSRLFRRELGTNFVKYITEQRIEKASRLLKDTALGVAEIADRCGFSNANYFAKIFRKHRGISPGGYRKCSDNRD